MARRSPRGSADRNSAGLCAARMAHGGRSPRGSADRNDAIGDRSNRPHACRSPRGSADRNDRCRRCRVTAARVAPRAGARIETPSASRAIGKSAVAPRAGARIETFINQKPFDHGTRRSPRGGVATDRQPHNQRTAGRTLIGKIPISVTWAALRIAVLQRDSQYVMYPDIRRYG